MTTQPISAGFEFDVITVELEKLLPTRALAVGIKSTSRYRALVASIQEVGLIEPLSVYPQKGGRFLLLDGHARAEALRGLGKTEAPCLKALKDEGYLYNQKVNRISPIQGARMILKALQAGVPEARVAKALNITVRTVRTNGLLLRDICPEAVDVLKDKQISQVTLGLLKKVKPMRQIEMAEIMVAAGVYSLTYARALVRTTSKDQLVDPTAPQKIPGIRPEDLSRVEHEMCVQEQDFRMLDETYNEHVMALTIARGYLRPMLENGRVVKYLAKNFREFLAEFQRIAESSTLEG